MAGHSASACQGMPTGLVGGLPGGGAGRRAAERSAGRGRPGLTCLSPLLLALAPLPSRRPPHPQEALSLFEIPDSGTGERVFLQRVYQQREAAAAVPDAEPDRPTSENLVSEQKNERKKTKQRPAAVFLGKSSTVTADRALWREGERKKLFYFIFIFYFLTHLLSAGGKLYCGQGWPPLPLPAILSGTSFYFGLTLARDRHRAWKGGGEGKCLAHWEWTPLAPRPRLFI